MSENKEYVVKLGWKVDSTTFASAQNKLKSFSDNLKKVGESVAKNKGLKEAGEKFAEFFKNLDQTAGAAVKKFAASSEAAILGGIAAISVAVATLAVTAGVAFSKFAGGVAKGDLDTQLLARRLLTTADNARSLKAVMDTMGLKDVDELKQVALNPELRKQFLELRKLAASQRLNTGQVAGLKSIREVGFEFKKLGLMADLFGQKIVGTFGVLFKTQLEGVGKGLEKSIRLLDKALTVGFKFASLLDKSGIITKAFDHFTQSIGNRIDALLNILNIAADALGGGKEKRSDVYKEQEQTQNLLQKDVGGIYSLLTKAWSFISGIFSKIGRGLSKLNPLVPLTQAGKVVQGATKEVIEKLKNSPAGKVVQGWAGAGGLSVNKGVKLTKELKAYIGDLGSRLKSNFNVTEGVAPRAHGSRHPSGGAIDVGAATKTAKEIAHLIQEGLKTPGTLHANVELYNNKLYPVLAELKALKVDMSRIKTDRRFMQGEHIHFGVEPRQVTTGPVTIHINGENKDPKAIAQEIKLALSQRDTRSTRANQSVVL